MNSQSMLHYSTLIIILENSDDEIRVSSALRTVEMKYLQFNSSEHMSILFCVHVVILKKNNHVFSSYFSGWELYLTAVTVLISCLENVLIAQGWVAATATKLYEHVPSEYSV